MRLGLVARPAASGVERDIQKINLEIEIDSYAPGFLAFAGNGGGEVLAFDAAGAVYMLPLIGMETCQAMFVAESFDRLGQVRMPNNHTTKNAKGRTPMLISTLAIISLVWGDIPVP
jgi:hypothetical protein